MVIKLEDDDYINYLNEQKVNNDENIDPVYKIFLEHLREDGKSYIFEMKNGDNGLPATVKYGMEYEVPENKEADKRTGSGTISFEGGDNSVVKRGLKRRSCSNSSEVFNLSNSSPSEEETYLSFLSHLKLKGHSMIFEHDSFSITYEEERDTLESLENLAPVSNANTDEQGLIPYESTEPSDLIVYEDGNSSITSMASLECYEITDFKTKLMFILNKPYNQTEYEALLKEANARKPLNKQKHLRSMSISYATEEVGQSYLDHFPDLAKQISSAVCHRRLNLLRGFFFWLKNLCHEGAYMPWASSGYEVIEPDDSEVVLPLDVARD